MAKCGCAGDTCSCVVVAGRGARVSGKGTINDPYVIDTYPMSLSVADSDTVNLTLSGTGQPSDPWQLRADIDAGSFDSMWAMWTGTQAQYDALGVWYPNTLYAITG